MKILRSKAVSTPIYIPLAIRGGGGRGVLRLGDYKQKMRDNSIAVLIAITRRTNSCMPKWKYHPKGRERQHKLLQQLEPI